MEKVPQIASDGVLICQKWSNSYFSNCSVDPKHIKINWQYKLKKFDPIQIIKIKERAIKKQMKNSVLPQY